MDERLMKLLHGNLIANQGPEFTSRTGSGKVKAELRMDFDEDFEVYDVNDFVYSMYGKDFTATYPTIDFAKIFTCDVPQRHMVNLDKGSHDDMLRAKIFD